MNISRGFAPLFASVFKVCIGRESEVRYAILLPQVKIYSNDFVDLVLDLFLFLA